MLAPPANPAGRLGMEEAGEAFSEADLRNFMTGYRSQYEERAYWIDPGAVEGRCQLPAQSCVVTSCRRCAIDGCLGSLPSLSKPVLTESKL